MFSRVMDEMPDAPAPPPRPNRAIARQATSVAAYSAGPVPDAEDPLLGFAPFFHPQPRRNSITPELQRRFVATLAATGIVNQAARSIGKSMEALYKLRARPGAEGFAGAWDAALERGLTRLEDCALERALQGTATPIVSGGEILGWWEKPDNNLLRFLLQQRLPARYGLKAVGPGHPLWDTVRAAVLADPAVREREERMREAMIKAQAEVRDLEHALADAELEIERLRGEAKAAGQQRDYFEELVHRARAEV